MVNIDNIKFSEPENAILKYKITSDTLFIAIKQTISLIFIGEYQIPQLVRRANLDRMKFASTRALSNEVFQMSLKAEFISA